MDVRICGPNLSSAAQQKGDLHVHRADCSDLRKYGPQYKGRDRMGGDLNGNRELLIENATVRGIVEFCYSDQIAESGDSWDDYVSSFWFAPCCKDMPYDNDKEPAEGEVQSLVFECWIAQDRHSFMKLKSDDLLGITEWTINALKQARPGTHINLVCHDEKEYS